MTLLNNPFSNITITNSNADKNRKQSHLCILNFPLSRGLSVRTISGEQESGYQQVRNRILLLLNIHEVRCILAKTYISFSQMYFMKLIESITTWKKRQGDPFRVSMSCSQQRGLTMLRIMDTRMRYPDLFHSCDFYKFSVVFLLNKTPNLNSIAD